MQTPYLAPNCNAYAERLVRSIKEECLDRIIFVGEAHLRWTLREFAAHYHHERNHQGLHDRLILPEPTGPPTGAIRCRPRIGGLLRRYYRAVTHRLNFRIVRHRADSASSTGPDKAAVRRSPC